MLMNGTVLLPAPRSLVWDKLNDPEVLKACISGCESLERDGDASFAAVVNLKIGPIKAQFKGHVQLCDLNAPSSYRIEGGGEGGLAGFAKGVATVTLEVIDGDGTRLNYDVEAQVGGKIAQLGGRLMDSVAKRYADSFFATFGEICEQEVAT